MLTVTLDALRTRARRYADQERAGLSSDDFVSDEELAAHINDAALQLLAVIAEEYGAAAAVSADLSSVVGQELYALPTDLFEVLSIDFKGQPIFKFGAYEAADDCSCPRWQIEAGPKVRFLPASRRAGDTFRVWYIQSYPTLAAANDALTLWPHGDTYIAATAAMAMLGKEESDFQFPLGLRQQAEQAIRDNGRRIRPKMSVIRRRNHRCIQ